MQSNRILHIKVPFMMTNDNFKGSGDLMDKVSASQPRDRGFEPHTCHDHYFSFDTSTAWS